MGPPSNVRVSSCGSIGVLRQPYLELHEFGLLGGLGLGLCPGAEPSQVPLLRARVVLLQSRQDLHLICARGQGPKSARPRAPRSPARQGGVTCNHAKFCCPHGPRFSVYHDKQYARLFSASPGAATALGSLEEGRAGQQTCFPGSSLVCLRLVLPGRQLGSPNGCTVSSIRTNSCHVNL